MDETPIGEIHPASCGTISAPSTSQSTNITLHVCPTTGGNFSLDISNAETVDGLKKAISRKLKVTKDRINVLHKDRILKDGTLAENTVVDGSRLTLLPNVETGLMSQKADHTVMQALENLSDSQVNDFLAGKAPLTLAMRLGDHMMFVQLQLSTSTAGNKKSSGSRSTAKRRDSNNPRVPSSTITQSAQPQSVQPQSAQPRRSVATMNTIQKSEPTPSTSGATTSWVPEIPAGLLMAGAQGDKPVLNTAALAQASRNLSQKLRELSTISAHLQKAAEPCPPSTSAPSSNKKAPGAIIESMQHHGHGVYSGTFSGTLNPALQDSEGKPKKDVTTIIHILNDLLGAQPGCRNHPAGKSSSRKHDKSARNCRSKLSGVEKVRLTQENRATRGKMEQIRAMLEERRQKRKERQTAKTTEPFAWENRERNGSDSSMTEGDEMDIDANLEASVTDNVTDNETAYQNLTHESSILA